MVIWQWMQLITLNQRIVSFAKSFHKSVFDLWKDFLCNRKLSGEIFDFKNVWDYPFCLQAGELAVYNILCYNKSKQTME
jgi:hypothetical protein